MMWNGAGELVMKGLQGNPFLAVENEPQFPEGATQLL